MPTALQRRGCREAVKRRVKWEDAGKDPHLVLKIADAMKIKYVHHAETDVANRAAG